MAAAVQRSSAVRSVLSAAGRPAGCANWSTSAADRPTLSRRKQSRGAASLPSRALEGSGERGEGAEEDDRRGRRWRRREGEERGINYRMCNILQFVPNLFTTICTKSIHYSLYKIYSPRCIHDDELPVVPLWYHV